MEMTQEELRTEYRKRLEREKQIYIAKAIGVDYGILSRFKNNKMNLYPHLFKKLELYLTSEK